MTELTNEEARGIEAIQYLQSMVSVDETTEEALAEWRAMSDEDKEQTMVIFEYMLGIFA